MKCLIPAAGAGQRLQAESSIKPLACLLGVPLLERVIRTAQQAGLMDFTIVTGYEGDRIRQALGDGRPWGVRLHYLENPDWPQGNGSSVLAARRVLKEKEPFLLCMADHLFDPAILSKLQETPLDGAGVVLAVDRAPVAYCDVEDATKVRLQGDRILDIGKDLPRYDAFDTGLFLCSPEIFDALEEARERGDGSLSAGVRRLARQGRAKALDVTGRFWIDVDTPRSFRAAEGALLARLRKPTDGPVSRCLNRPLSTRLSRWLVRTPLPLPLPLRPNHLSALSFALAALGAGVMALPGYAALAAGGLLAQVSSIVDGCDGEVARLKFQASDFGGWMDAVLDRYADALLVGGLTYHLWTIHPYLSTWLWGLAALSGVLLNSYTADKYDQFLKRRLEQARARRPLRLGRDVRLFLLFLGAVANLPSITLAALALISHLEVLRRIRWLSRRA